MAHYRSSLFLLTCLACLSFAPSRAARLYDLTSGTIVNKPVTGGQDAHPTRNFPLCGTGILPVLENGARCEYNQNPTSASLAHGERGNFRSFPAITIAIAPVTAQEPSPKTPKPTLTPNQQPTDPKKAKANSSNSRIPQPASAIIRILLRQRSLFLLSLAALLVTSGAVFILLKLVSSEPDNLKPKVAIARSRKPKKNRRRNHNSEDDDEEEVSQNAAQRNYTPPYPSATTRDYAIDNSDRNSPAIFDPNDAEPQGVIPYSGNSDTLAPENHSNGYSDLGFNLSEKINAGDIFVEETSRLPKINIIHQLIADLAHPNPTKRHKAIWELGDRGDSRAIRPLVDLLLNSDSKQHSLILSSLSEIGIKILKPMNRAWLISLQNENAEVRKNAIRDLTRIYELVNQVDHLLQRAADDPDAEVQETARWALNQLNRTRPLSGKESWSSWSNTSSLTDNNSNEDNR